LLFWWTTIRMPGTSFRGPVADVSADEYALAKVLERDVRVLAGDIGERNVRHPAALDAAASFIEQHLRDASLQPRRSSFVFDGHAVHNIDVVIPGSTGDAPLVVVGAHYDSALDTAGANDNASGVAVLLELARRLGTHRAERELRLVWFTNEEPPHFQTNDMGSLRYARALAAEGREVVAMLSLETLGFYSDSPDTQSTRPQSPASSQARGTFSLSSATTLPQISFESPSPRFARRRAFLPRTWPRAATSLGLAGPTTGRSGKPASPPSC
jgi:hypothetical protein